MSTINSLCNQPSEDCKTDLHKQQCPLHGQQPAFSQLPKSLLEDKGSETSPLFSQAASLYFLQAGGKQRRKACYK